MASQGCLVQSRTSEALSISGTHILLKAHSHTLTNITDNWFD